MDSNVLHRFGPRSIEGTRGYLVIQLIEMDDHIAAEALVYDGYPDWALKTPENSDRFYTARAAEEWAEAYAHAFLPEESEGDEE